MEENHMIIPGDVVVAGISGGADSVCLLFVLLEIKKEVPFFLTAVHVNHGIREEAGEDAEFVQQLCDDQGIICHHFATDILRQAKEKGLSEEEAGRDFRYQCFRQVLERSMGSADSGKGKIAVAHHLEDQAETMLFNLFRGSGLRGLAAIRPVRADIIRPLLFVRRSEVISFLESRKIAFLTDPTNEEDKYARNRIRHHILPQAEEINRHAVQHMSQAAEYIWQAEEYLAKQTEILAEKLVSIFPGQVEIDLNLLMKQDILMQNRVFLYAVDQIVPGRKNVTAAHIAGLSHIAGGSGSKETCLPEGYYGIRKYGKIVIKKRLQADSSDDSFTVTDFESLRIPNLGILKSRIFPLIKSQIIPQKPYTKWFDYDKITTSAIFRTSRQEDYLTIDQAGHRKSLRRYMIDVKIPREERDQMYVLADAAHIMWVPGYRISEYYKVSDQTVTILELDVFDRVGRL